MEEKDIKQIESVLTTYLNKYLKQIIVSNPIKGAVITKVKLRPLFIRGEMVFQSEEFVGNQVFHKNMNQEQAISYLIELLSSSLKQMDLMSQKENGWIRMSKKKIPTIKIKPVLQREGVEVPLIQAHNRQKQYILKEGIPVPFLEDLGIMTSEGNVVRARYDKFRQVNRYLEFIEDILPKLDQSKESVIIDFGCGKSYLTFAMYYYLNVLKEYPVRLIGLDLKKDVIERCNGLAKQYGFDRLTFLHGDIASFDGENHVDMVVSLHACDTATDYAIAKAVEWNASVILAVPCCQHELNSQIHNDLLQPILQYGFLKERMAALLTDGIRAEILECCGYRTQVLEFIDMEHTPKNLLIRAVKQGMKKGNEKEIKRLLTSLHAKPKLAELLLKDRLL